MLLGEMLSGALIDQDDTDLGATVQMSTDDITYSNTIQLTLTGGSYSGNIYFGKKIDRMQKHHFNKRDIANQNKDYAVEFSFSTLERRIKTLDVVVGKNSKLTCYIKVNDRIMTEGIVFINSGENPKEIPFSLSADGIQ